MEFKVYQQLWFPIPIWECPVIGIDNKEIKEYCLKIREELPGKQVSNRGGWHSDKVLLPIPESLDSLFSHLQLFVNEVCYNDFGIKLKFGNFWININSYHDYNVIHDHQKSILSGVYYVDVPDDNMGDLILHRGDTAEFFLKNINEQTTVNSLTCIKKPKTSTFYLFPSWVKHSVERNESFKERISIAFNFVSENE